MNITFQGSSVTLKGTPLTQGAAMPDFKACFSDLTPVSGRDLTGPRIFLSIPSLDTGVCDMEVKKFNQEASKLGGISVYAVSLDLPFAQERWCGAGKIETVRTISDYQERSFGYATGTFIEGICLLTRAVFIVNSDNRIVYAEYVPEITSHPDYEAALRAAKEMLSS